MKTCKRCGQAKAVDEFYLAPANKEGRKGNCKECCRRAMAARWQRNKARPPADIQQKRCSGCKETKPIKDFYRLAGAIDGFDSYCTPCRRVRAEAPSRIYAVLKSRAAKRGLSATITKEEYLACVSGGSCCYCGGGLPATGHGLDRKDNNIGYIPGNCVPCCWFCNKVKNDCLSYDDMMILAAGLAEIRRRREAAGPNHSSGSSLNKDL